MAHSESLLYHPHLSIQKVNQTKSVYVTFTNRTIDCPIVTIKGTLLPVQIKVKYLSLQLDQMLTRRTQITAKKTQINHKLRQMHWLIGRKSKLMTENKLLLYKAILKPIWTYGIQLCCSSKPSNTNSYNAFSSKYCEWCSTHRGT